MISWWRAEGDAFDAQGTNNGTLQGAVGFTAGEVGQAFSFTGAGNYVQVPDSPSLNFGSTSPMTVELWAYRTGTQTTMHLLGKRLGNCGSFQYQMAFSPADGLGFYGGAGQVTTTLQMPLNTWVHLAATFDGTTFRFYYNGVFIGQGSGNLGPAASAPFTIGTSSSCPPFVGLMDEVCLYNRALSGTEIQSLYNAGAAGKCLSAPTITIQPHAQTADVTGDATFGVTATGTQPLYYQWRLEGATLPGATGSILQLHNLGTNQAGNYSVVVSNSVNSVTSSNALLTVVQAGSPGNVSVCDQAGLFVATSAGGNVTFGCDGTILLNTTLMVTQNLVLDGGGHAVTISGNHAVRLFYVAPGVQLTLRNLTLADGSQVATNNLPGLPAYGAAVYNNGGSLTVINCTFSGHTAVGGDSSSGPAGSGCGGAIYSSQGFLFVTNCSFVGNSVFSGNTAYSGGVAGAARGGAILSTNGVVRIDRGLFAMNSATGGRPGDGSTGGGAFGGGLAAVGGDASIINSTFLSNTLTAVHFFPNSNSRGGEASGAAVYQGSGTLILMGNIFATNKATGGALDHYFGSSGPARGGGVFNAGTLTAISCSFLGNSVAAGAGGYTPADGTGGAICNIGNATISQAIVSGNQSVGGGGIEIGNGGFTVTGNGYGGGIFNSNALALLNSTLAGNLAIGGPGAFSGGPGGKSYGGGLYDAGSCSATNVTLYANAAIGGPGGSTSFPYYMIGPGGSGYGGGVYDNGGTTLLVNTTLAGNSAAGGSGDTNSPAVGYGGGVGALSGSLTLYNSIVANSASGGDCFAFVTDGGYNLNSDGSVTFSATGSLNNTDPKLGSFGDYGGPTQTIPLLPGSPAIDAVPAASAPPTDQRGFARPYGPASDMGAFEATPIYSISGQVSGSGVPFGTTITIGTASVIPDIAGHYSDNGVVAGTYSVTPSAAGMFFMPSSRTVTVGPSTNSVNFRAYQLNAARVEGYSDSVLHLAFAGTNGQPQVIETSSNLVTWVPMLTNTIGANGVLDFFGTNAPGQTGRFFRSRTP